MMASQAEYAKHRTGASKTVAPARVGLSVKAA